MSIEKKKQNVVHKKKKKTLLKTIIIRKKSKFFFEKLIRPIFPINLLSTAFSRKQQFDNVTTILYPKSTIFSILLKKIDQKLKSTNFYANIFSTKISKKCSQKTRNR